MFMEIVKNRIKKRLSSLNLTQAELAKMMGKDSQTINNWGARNSIPNEFLFKLAVALKCSAMWLQTGIDDGVVYDTNDGLIKTSIRDDKSSVPIISWVQAGSTHVAFIDSDSDYKTINTNKKTSKNAYALIVNGGSMTAPNGARYTFPEGCIIICDPDQKGDNTDGIFVIAKEDGNDAVTFKQLKHDGTTPYLNPLNPDYPKIFGKFRIIAKVIDAKLPELP